MVQVMDGVGGPIAKKKGGSEREREGQERNERTSNDVGDRHVALTVVLDVVLEGHARLGQQIANGLVVDLQEGGLQRVLPALLLWEVKEHDYFSFPPLPP